MTKARSPEPEEVRSKKGKLIYSFFFPKFIGQQQCIFSLFPFTNAINIIFSVLIW